MGAYLKMCIVFTMAWGILGDIALQFSLIAAFTSYAMFGFMLVMFNRLSTMGYK